MGGWGKQQDKIRSELRNLSTDKDQAVKQEKYLLRDVGAGILGLRDQKNALDVTEQNAGRNARSKDKVRSSRSELRLFLGNFRSGFPQTKSELRFSLGDFQAQLSGSRGKDHTSS